MIRIAVPLAGGRVSPHFGRCESLVLVDVDERTGLVSQEARLEVPPHEPGLLPRWLLEHGVRAVVAGGIGRRARSILEEAGVAVVVGVTGASPAEIATACAQGRLAGGRNLCGE